MVNVARLYYVVDYVVKSSYLATPRGVGRLRSVKEPPSWHATGLVRAAWRRVVPHEGRSQRDELAFRMGVSPNDLSARNTSSPSKPKESQKPMTFEYAARVVAGVLPDDPTFSVADLGAPASVVAEVDPTTADLLRELAEKLATTETNLAGLKGRHDRLQGRVRKLEAALRERGGDAPRDQAADA